MRARELDRAPALQGTWPSVPLGGRGCFELLAHLASCGVASGKTFAHALARLASIFAVGRGASESKHRYTSKENRVAENGALQRHLLCALFLQTLCEHTHADVRTSKSKEEPPSARPSRAKKPARSTQQHRAWCSTRTPGPSADVNPLGGTPGL